MYRAQPPTAILLAILGLALFSGGPTFAAGERRVELYPVRHRIAAELIPIAETALGASGTASLDARTNSILLVGPDDEVASALEILRAQDHAPRTILVRQGWLRSSELRDARVEVQWSATSGDIRIGRVIPPSRDDELSVRAYVALRKKHQERAVEVRVVEGASARFETGTVVPFATGSEPGQRSGAGAQANTTWVDVTTGLSTRARVLGNGRVRVELSPFESSLGGAGTLARTAATTSIELAPGEMHLLAGIGSRRGATGSERGHGTQQSAGDEDRVLVVTVDILSDAERLEQGNIQR